MADPAPLIVPLEIETARLLLRCPQPGDGAIVHASVVASLAALREFPASLPWAMADPSVAASEQFCREGQVSYLARTGFPMLIFAKDSGSHVGNCGLHDFDWAVPKCEIGYWGHVDHARHGFITEAVTALTSFALETLKVRRVYALPDAENRPSCVVCERNGYALEGSLRHDRIAPDGSLRSTRVYAKTR